MVKPVWKTIYLRDADGGVKPFDANALQTRLAGAFLAAGMAEDAFVSGEIVLALEYTLLRSPRAEAVFGCGEVDTELVRLLESIGFPQVAAAFRKNASVQVIEFSTEEAELRKLIQPHLGCSAERMEKIIAKVAAAMKQLGISAASPHLLWELAHHYEREEAERDLLSGDGEPLIPEVTLTRQDVYSVLDEQSEMMVEQGILHICGVTTLFPGLQFFFNINGFAKQFNWLPPVTELELTPALYRAGAVLEQARRSIVNALGKKDEDVPLCLTIPGMLDFVTSYLDCKANEKIAAELADALSSSFAVPLYKLSFE